MRIASKAVGRRAVSHAPASGEPTSDHTAATAVPASLPDHAAASPLAPLPDHAETAPPQVASSVLATIGRTPLIRLSGFLEVDDVTLYVKLEAANPGGSVKDRPAVRMIEQAIRSGRIGPHTIVIESSSGNTGIGLAQVCAYYGLRFVCVVDGRAQPHNLAIMRALGAEIDRVDAPLDGSVDLLSARLERVTALLAGRDDAFWPNQYANDDNPRAHELGTMAEIDTALGGGVDDLFVAVSSTGTLGGCIDHLSSHRRRTRVVAVDAVGSALFGGAAGPRVIPGLGAGRIPELAAGREVDEVVRVTDLDCVVGCRRLARTDALLVGGSAGGALQVVRSRQDQLRGRTCVVVAADSGHRYLDTVFDDGWVTDTLGVSAADLDALVGPVRGGRQ
jgi:N-(2-amino-2-carboxyethyl)-L-glutamate synthase